MSSEELILFKEKYKGIFKSQMEKIVFIIQIILFATRELKIVEDFLHGFPSFRPESNAVLHMSRIECT